MATIRRLSDADVRSIFECLHHNRPPPSQLHFSIVSVGVNGLKLSPPSYEFEGRFHLVLHASYLPLCFNPTGPHILLCHYLFVTLDTTLDGLYVLLRPEKKKRSGTTLDIPQPPSHLTHLLLKEQLPEVCPWSLSGPQFPQPTAIQQRYCYPKGRPDYSSRKGGALWTMYGADGKEDLEYRLLHVYFSAKRAVNKGYTVPEEDIMAIPPAAKRSKRSPERFFLMESLASHTKTTATTTTTTTIATTANDHAIHSPPLTALTVNARKSDTTTTSTYPGSSCSSFPGDNHHDGVHFTLSTSSSLCSSPPLSPPFRTYSNDFSVWDEHNFVSPSDRAFSSFHPIDESHLWYHPSVAPTTTTATSATTTIPHSPMRYPLQLLQHALPLTPASPAPSHGSLHSASLLSEPLEWKAEDWEGYWKEDPMLSSLLISKPSQEVWDAPPDTPTHQLTTKLEQVHHQLRDWVLSAPNHEQQGILTSILTGWAQQVATNPLGGSQGGSRRSHVDEEEEDDDDDTHSYGIPNAHARSIFSNGRRTTV
jgi:hypothetical protein